MNKKFITVFIIFLSLTLIAFISITFAYFKSEINLKGNITLGELDFTLNSSFEENMFALPNSTIKCELELVNQKENGQFNNLIPFYFRFRIDAVSNSENVVINPNINADLFFNDGEFYYFKNVVEQNTAVNICKSVVIDKNTGNNVQGYLMEINLLFEAIQYNAASDIWGEEISNNLNIF